MTLGNGHKAAVNLTIACVAVMLFSLAIMPLFGADGNARFIVMIGAAGVHLVLGGLLFFRTMFIEKGGAFTLTVVGVIAAFVIAKSLIN